MARSRMQLYRRRDGGYGGFGDKDAWPLLQDGSAFTYHPDLGKALPKDADLDWHGRRQWAASASPRQWLVPTGPQHLLKRIEDHSGSSALSARCHAARPGSQTVTERSTSRPTHRKFKVWSGPCTPRSASSISSARDAIDARRPMPSRPSTSPAAVTAAALEGTTPRGQRPAAAAEGAAGLIAPLATAPLEGSAKARLELRRRSTPQTVTFPPSPLRRNWCDGPLAPAGGDPAHGRTGSSLPCSPSSASKMNGPGGQGGCDSEWLQGAELPARQRIVDGVELSEIQRPVTPRILGPRAPLPQGQAAAESAAEEEQDLLENLEVPLFDMQRPTGPVGNRECRPSYDLWISLHGGNGRTVQRRALQQWELQLVDHQDAVRAFEEEERRRRAAQAEALRRKKIAEEELRRRVEEAEQEAIKRREAERLQKEREIEEELQRRLAEERRRELLKPRACEACAGSGSCGTCDGTGCKMALHLTTMVSSTDDSSVPVQIRVAEHRPRGLLPSGCQVCGGAGDAFWGTFEDGDGLCRGCGGSGKVAAPPGGWPA